MGEQYTITISTNLVNRLVDDADKKKKSTKKANKPKLPPAQHKSEQQPPLAVTPVWPIHPLPPPPPVYPELEAIRSLVQESEKVVERLQKEEEKLTQQVTQRAKDLHDKEFKLPYQKPMPCSAQKDACLDCYKQHPKDPLKCAAFVNSFADCARKLRQQQQQLS